jgi:hypothetical protein
MATLDDASTTLNKAGEHPIQSPRKPDRQPCFLITVDAECDDAWSSSGQVRTENARFLPRFQALCESYRLKTTYLTTFEMALSPVFQEFGRDVLKRGAGEIGMHLHAWNSPPIVPLTSNDGLYHPYLTEYPEPVMRDKIAFLTDLLEDTFEIKMTSHRGGRWGFGPAYARLLAERGYLADGSVTPLISWSDHLGDPQQGGGPDYRRFPRFPYFLDLENISCPGNSRLLEIPVTTMELQPGPLRALSSWLPQRSFARRVLKRLFPPLCMFAPTRHNLRSLLKVVEKSVAAKSGCVHFALHSSNLMPGGSPPFREAEDVEALYDALDRVLSVAAQNFRGATLTEFRRDFPDSGV